MLASGSEVPMSIICRLTLSPRADSMKILIEQLEEGALHLPDKLMLHLHRQLAGAQILRKGGVDDPHSFSQLTGTDRADQTLLCLQRVIVGRILNLHLLMAHDSFMVRVHGIFQRLSGLLEGGADLCDR